MLSVSPLARCPYKLTLSSFKYPTFTQECADSLGLHSDEYIFTIQLPKKFGVRSMFVYFAMRVTNHLKAPVSAYNADSAQRTTKKKLLSLGSKVGTPSILVERATKDVIEDDSGATGTGTGSFPHLQEANIDVHCPFR